MISTLVSAIILLQGQVTDLKSDIVKRYGEWDRAYRTKDVKTLSSMLDARFKLITGSGKVITRRAYVKTLGDAKPPKIYRTKLLKVEKSGDQAFAWTAEQSGSNASKLHEHRYRDTWVKKAGRWLLRESKTLGEH